MKCESKPSKQFTLTQIIFLFLIVILPIISSQKIVYEKHYFGDDVDFFRNSRKPEIIKIKDLKIKSNGKISKIRVERPEIKTNNRPDFPSIRIDNDPNFPIYH